MFGCPVSTSRYHRTSILDNSLLHILPDVLRLMSFLFYLITSFGGARTFWNQELRNIAKCFESNIYTLWCKIKLNTYISWNFLKDVSFV